MAHEPIFLDVQLMESNDAQVIARTKLQLLALLHGLTAHDRFYLDYNVRNGVPPLYGSGVQYERDQNDWRDIPQCLKKKRANCKDFAAWRCAELRMAGIKAKPYIMWHRLPSGFWQFHAVVLRQTADEFLPPFMVAPDGKPTMYPSDDGEGIIEDPSRVLGMGWNEWKP